ncbi:MAG: Plug and carboxypeptidase regulatory-like domain-containing protein, partial [Gammaproteobacteria bacterium]|nr:Plug and carboxypeptidase regulatory-like domain-containing protein [Gammaproteobacteria bacterium]
MPTNNRPKVARNIFLVAALTVSAIMPIQAAGNSGEIVVTAISEQTRRPIPNVAITVVSRSGDLKELFTDDSGTARFENMEVGLYRLTATGEGFIQVVEPTVRVIIRKTTLLRLEMLTSERPAELEGVVIQSRAKGADPSSAVSATYLDREALRTAVGGGADVLRALDGLPGLVATGEFSSFSVRGRGPRDNLIFVDGYPFDKAVHFDSSLGEQEEVGGGGRFSIFAPNIIGGAEFSPGGWSAAYGGRAGSLLKLNVAEGNPSPSANFRIDLAGYEVGYDGPSGFHDGTSFLFTARRLDFGQFFETIEELDIGEPVLTDVIFKSVSRFGANDKLEFLVLYTPEEFTRDVKHVVESDNFEDTELRDDEQDSSLIGVNWSRLIGATGEWSNRFFYRSSDKTSSEGEAFPDLVPIGAPLEDIP